MMAQCKHLEWLRLVRGGSNENVEITDRFDRLVQNLPHFDQTFPSLAIFIGNQRKNSVLKQFDITSPISGSDRTYIHTPRLVSFQEKNLPLFIFDTNSFSKSRLSRAPINSRCHETTSYKLPLELTQKPTAEIFDHIHHRLLFPFTDLICLFVDDLGGLANVTDRLDTWLKKGRASAAKSSPYLFLVVDELDSSMEFKLRSLLNLKSNKKSNSTFKGYRIFNLSRPPPQTRASSCQGNSWSRIHKEIIDCLYAVRRSRIKEGEQFSAPHISTLLRYAAKTLNIFDLRPLDLVKSTRTLNPVAADLDLHLSIFLRNISSSDAVGDFAIPMIISSFILDSFPPGMHLFRPRVVFKTIYFDICLRVFTQWSSNADKLASFELPLNFVSLLEAEMVRQFTQFRKEKSAVLHHQAVMSLFRSKWTYLKSTDTCLCCLRRRPQYCLPCSHCFCENCVQVFGQNSEYKPWVYLVERCLLCQQTTNRMEIAIKPPTASVRVLSIDGGGTRGRAPLEFLQALQDQLKLPYPVQRNFDMIYGTSSGAIIAAALCSLDWTIEECTRYFQMFARVAFQPRWWWLRIPFLSGILQIVVSLLVDSRYSSKGLEAILQEVLGTRSIMDCSNAAAMGSKLGITVTTIRDARACVFTSYNGVGNRQDDMDYHVLKPQNGLNQIRLWEIVRCSTAAPYYFKPKHIHGVGTFQDGGLMFNNPASIAVREVAILFPDTAEPSIVVSLGTGSSKASDLVTTKNTHFFRDSYPARVYRAFWNSSDSKRAWQQLTNYTKLSTTSDLFRFDIEFDGRGPALDDVGEMEKIGRLARESIIESPGLSRLAQRIRAELFIFELDPVSPIRFIQGKFQCSGRISCRLGPSTNELDIFFTQLKDSTASFRVCNHTIQVCSPSGPKMKDGAVLSVDVKFSVASRSELIEIELCEGEGEGSKISGSPFTLQRLIEQQNIEACFGTANHLKRSNTGAYGGQVAKRQRNHLKRCNTGAYGGQIAKRQRNT